MEYYGAIKDLYIMMWNSLQAIIYKKRDANSTYGRLPFVYEGGARMNTYNFATKTLERQTPN